MATTQAPRQSLSGSQPKPKRNWLAEIKTTVEARPSTAVLYGVSGIGKTSMAANIPGVVFITDPQEDGITTLKAGGLVPQTVPQFPAATSWDELLDQLDWLASNDHGHKAVALDALGGLERLCHEHVCRRDFGGDWSDRGFQGYMRGYDVALADWRLFLSALDRVRSERRMSVFLLGHAKVGQFRNPEGPDYDRWSVDVHHKTWGLTHRWADLVLFANFEVHTTKDGLKTKAKGGQTRMLYTEHHAAYDAKNRHNLPPEIDMGNSGQEAWSNFVQALKTGKEA